MRAWIIGFLYCQPFNREEGGNIAVVAALISTIIFMFAAFGVDEASIYFDRRTLQGNTDVAAIVAANNLSKAQTAALLSLQDNNVLPTGSTGQGQSTQTLDATNADLKVETGRYTADSTINVNQRFDPSASNINAARVTVQKSSKLFFASFFSTAPVLESTAVARRETLGSFSIGSRLASLNGGVLNSILSGILGTNVSLSVLDYQALASTNVDLLPTLDTLGSKLNVTAGTYDSLLANSISYADFADALSRTDNLSTSASGILRDLSRQSMGANVNIPLSKLFDLGSVGNLAIGQPHHAVQITATLLNMLDAGALLGGNHQVQIDLGATIPGLTQTTLDLEIGEPPQSSAWLKVGETGTTVFTAQTRLRLITQVGGTGLLSGMTIRLPLYLDVASAQGTLTGMQCAANNTPQSMTVAVQSGVVGSWIGEVNINQMDDLSNNVVVAPASMITAPLLRATGSAYTQMGNQNATNVNFSASDISNHVVKTVSTSDFTSSLTGSLLNSLSVQVSAIGLGLSTSAVTAALKTVLVPVTPSIDKVLYSVLNLVGVKVGQADVWANGVDCASAVLVQ